MGQGMQPGMQQGMQPGMQPGMQSGMPPGTSQGGFAGLPLLGGNMSGGGKQIKFKFVNDKNQKDFFF